VLALNALCPSTLHDLEQELHRAIARECIDPVVGSVIQAAHSISSVEERALTIMSCVSDLRLQVATQPVRISLLGGSKCTVYTPYYLRRPPRGPGRPRGVGKRGGAGNGVYPFLSALGIHDRVSPALGSEVARCVALGTVDLAQLQLASRGISLDRKVVRRLTMCLAERGLRYREWLVEQGQKGHRGSSCKGKRLVITGDGGRIRTRKRRRGRRLKSGHHAFEAQWREPKVFVIYEINADGKKVRRGRGLLRYGATMQDADGMFGQLEAILKEIGAQEAEEWVIIADGGEWIWNRVAKLIAALEFDSAKVTQVIDLYHAVQHLHKVAAEVNRWSDGQRKDWLKKLKGHLLKGRFQRVVEAIEELCRGRKAKKIRKLLPYFTEHADRMRYSDFLKRRVPIGSGAVESCVRRVVNLRLKGNGIFWTLESAEGVLHLRAQLLSGHWDIFVKTVLQSQHLWSISGPVEHEKIAA
jgi:ribosomal protein L29